MKIFVKKDNKLKPLGEGKIYSKSQLRLNEDKFLTTGNADNLRQAMNQAKKVGSENPNSGGYQVQFDQLNGQTDSGEHINIDASTEMTGDQQSALERVFDDPNIEDAKLTLKTPQQMKSDSNNINGMSESRITEMRKNSIPFTKKELSNFLSSL